MGTCQRRESTRKRENYHNSMGYEKKSNGTFRARLNARGYEQIDGKHYDSTSIHAPVVSDTSVRIIMVLGIMAHWMSHLVDVQGAFLNGNLESNEQMFMEVPQGFEKYFEKFKRRIKKDVEENSKKNSSGQIIQHEKKKKQMERRICRSTAQESNLWHEAGCYGFLEGAT